MKCKFCGREAVYFRPYSGEALCMKCFLDSVERKVRANISKYEMFEPDDRIAVAVSGGKDSLSLLYILDKIEREFPKSELIAITVNEGIKGYRNESIEIAIEFCRKLGVEHKVCNFKEFYGLTLDEIVEKSDGTYNPCTYCGVLRRKILNVVAREIGADKLAVAHNLDDEAQTVIINFVRGDPNRIARVKPTTDIVHPKLVKRVKPLCTIPEREIVLYAYFRKIRFQRSQCPYVAESLRNEIRNTLNRMEFMHPGTKYAIFRAAEKIRPPLEAAIGKPKINECEICGEPTPTKICKACQLLMHINAL